MFDEKEQFQEISENNIGIQNGPPLFLNFKDNTGQDEFDYCLKRVTIWAITIAFQGDNNGTLDS